MKYSLDEIDRMRKSLHTICIPMNTPYSLDSKIKEIEEKLRTYMSNGTSPEDLEARAKEIDELRWSRIKEENTQ